MDIKLSATDEKLLAIHSSMYPFVNYGTTGKTWYIKSTDYDEEFPTFKSFIRFVEEEVKCALLSYALSDRLETIAQALSEEE